MSPCRNCSSKSSCEPPESRTDASSKGKDDISIMYRELDCRKRAGSVLNLDYTSLILDGIILSQADV
jgi:hypothetical protein